VFPAPIGVAATWNPSLYRRMCAAVAAQTRAVGGSATCSPVLDVARDVRWGRVEETYGEDPHLACVFGCAAVEGLQGKDLAARDAIIATIKHFTAYGVSAGGHNAAPAQVGPRELAEICLPPFEAAVKAGAASLMASYNEIDGVPATCHREMLTGVLRQRWGFDGFVVSDWGAIPMLAEHGLSTNLGESARLALEAGIDVEIFHSAYGQPLVEEVKAGRVSMATVDQAVARVLRAKFRLGLFERPYVEEAGAQVVGCREHRDLARQVARESIVLLRNEGALLPLRKDIGSIAVIGPNADDIYNQLGDYTAMQDRVAIVTVLDGIKAAVGTGTEVRFAAGCKVRDASREGIAQAVELARRSDIAIVCVGGSSTRFIDPAFFDVNSGAFIPGKDTVSDTGEGLDRSDLDFSGVQLELLQAVAATGTPVVAVLINGRPISSPWLADNIPAIVEAWYPGEQGGHAVADVLFGDYNPAGRLTLSVPRSAGQLPVFYNHKPVARRNYIETSAEPLWPFGFGLSYTTFAYSNLRVSPGRIGTGDSAAVTVDVTNTGLRDGEEVVQLYLRDDVASVTRPVMELKGFRRLAIGSGRTETVTFTVGPAELQMLGPDLQKVVEPGTFTVMVGGDSRHVLKAPLVVE
jgi:beta-glucosidase